MDLASFPPFYTLQPVLATREKQLELWRQVVMSSVSGEDGLLVLDIATFAKFANPAINRQLDLDSRRVVCESLVSSGFAEWEDAQAKTRLRVYSKTPEAWATIVYDWANNSAGLVGQEISTFYELHSGEDGSSSSEIHGINSDLLLRALRILERKGKVFLYPGSTLDEMGVKFV